MLGGEQMENKYKQIRQRLHYTQKQWGELLGVGQSAVAQWENGTNHPGTIELYRLCEVSGESISELIKDRLKRKEG